MGKILSSLKYKLKRSSNEKIDDFVFIENKQLTPIMLKTYNLIDFNSNVIHIESNKIKKIQICQSNAYKYDKTGIEPFDCCVCIADDNEMEPLKCTHPICKKCYQTMIRMNNKKCPICRQEMQTINIYKLFCLFVPILKKINTILEDTSCQESSEFNHEIQLYLTSEHNNFFFMYGIAIQYLPPIYDKNDKIWIEQDFFYDIINDHNEKERFLDTYNRIRDEKYIVIRTPQIDKLMEEIFPQIEFRSHD